MKKLFTVLIAHFYRQERQRRFHAAVKRLPVYEIERLADTDFANVSVAPEWRRRPRRQE
jgi:hypothetical protein